MRRALPILAALLPPMAVTAQATVVIPNGFATTEATSSTAYPWGRGTAQIRVMYVYDSPNFTAQSLTTPLVITRLRWRANGGDTAPGGTFNNVVIRMSTAAVDYMAVTTTFASNHGPNLLTVYSGAVTVQAGAGMTPNNYYVDVTLQVPFVYDPNQGDLAVDMATDTVGWVGAAGPSLDSAGTAAAVSRVYNLTSWQGTTGTTQIGSSPVVEVIYAGSGPPIAAFSPFGQGCVLALSATNRPLLGTTLNLVTSNVPTNSLAGAVLLGATKLQPPVDLTVIGMPGCFLHIGVQVTLPMPITGTTGSLNLPIPNTPWLAGAHAYAQAATVSVGANPTGVLASNGGDIFLGTQ